MALVYPHSTEPEIVQHLDKFVTLRNSFTLGTNDVVLLLALNSSNSLCDCHFLLTLKRLNLDCRALWQMLRREGHGETILGFFEIHD